MAVETRATVQTKVPIVGKQVLSEKKRVPSGTVVKGRKKIALEVPPFQYRCMRTVRGQETKVHLLG